MNNISDKHIIQILQQDYDFITKALDNKNILGIYVYGKVNYNCAVNDEDITTEAMYIPSFEQICCNVEPTNYFFVRGDRTITVRDFRHIVNASKHFNHAVESLYTKFYIINPTYKQLYKKLLKDKREQIAYTNKQWKLLELSLKIHDNLHKFEYASDEVKKETSFLRYFGLMYLNDEPIEECLNVTQYRDQLFNDNEIDVAKLWEDCLYINNSCKNTNNNAPIDSPLIKKAMIQIMKLSTLSVQDVNNFITSLTELESDALRHLLKVVDKNNSPIPISALCEELGCSRPVFTNLLNKIKNSNMAEVVNHGKNGTSIKFFHPDLIKRHI